METAHHSAGFPGGLQDVHGVGAAAVDNALSPVPAYFGGNFTDSIIRRGNKHKIGGIRYFLIIVQYTQITD
jgi:hypothetical protein